MKKLLLLTLAAIFIIACQKEKQRYFDESVEIETLKASINAYEAQDWDAWKGNFADTAKIYHNTNKGASPDEMMTNMKQMLSDFSSYGFSDTGAEYEMVIDKKGRTWVNYWNTWHGKANITDKELFIPVHLTAQYINGKIVQEYAYYDTSGIGATIAEIEAAKAVDEAKTSEE